MPVLMNAAVPAICAHQAWQGLSADCSKHEDFSSYLLVWEFAGLKSRQQLQSLKEAVLVHGTAPAQSTAGDDWFVYVERLS